MYSSWASILIPGNLDILSATNWFGVRSKRLPSDMSKWPSLLRAAENVAKAGLIRLESADLTLKLL